MNTGTNTPATRQWIKRECRFETLAMKMKAERKVCYCNMVTNQREKGDNPFQCFSSSSSSFSLLSLRSDQLLTGHGQGNSKDCENEPETKRTGQLAQDIERGKFLLRKAAKG